MSRVKIQRRLLSKFQQANYTKNAEQIKNFFCIGTFYKTKYESTVWKDKDTWVNLVHNSTLSRPICYSNEGYKEINADTVFLVLSSPLVGYTNCNNKYSPDETDSYFWFNILIDKCVWTIILGSGTKYNLTNFFDMITDVTTENSGE